MSQLFKLLCGHFNNARFIDDSQVLFTCLFKEIDELIETMPKQGFFPLITAYYLVSTRLILIFWPTEAEIESHKKGLARVTNILTQYAQYHGGQFIKGTYFAKQSAEAFDP